MQQHHIPHAPPAPTPQFPGMPGLINDFAQVHLGPNGHHFDHNMHQPLIQPPRSGHVPDPPSFPSNSKPPIGHVGYILTKQPVEHPGQKETWAIVNRELMPGSQADLKNQVEKHRKKGVTGLDQYMHPDMKGFKRKQVDDLIQACARLDPDHRFEYNIASIRRDTRRRQSRLETTSMQVILKRQPRSGIEMQGPFMGFGSVPLPLSALVDLSGADDYEKSSQNSSNGHKPGAYPFERHLSEPWVHATHPDVRPPAHHAHSHDPQVHGHGHAEPGNIHAHGQEQPFHPHHGEAHDTKHSHEEKTKKHKNKEHQSPKIFVIKEHEIHKLHDHHSDSCSSSDSDSSSGDTDRTPDTIISSEGSHYHHKNKKYHKDKHHRKSSSHEHGHEPVQAIYREHKRKEPMRGLSSPPPPHRSHYRHEDVYVEPGFTSRRRQETIYPRERTPYHHRAMSYDDERLYEHDMRGLSRRPTIYRRRIASTAHPADLYDERAERRRQDAHDRETWEKEDVRMRERPRMDAARERIDLERMYRAAPRPQMDRMHGYYDDHLREYRDDRP